MEDLLRFILEQAGMGAVALYAIWNQSEQTKLYLSQIQSLNEQRITEERSHREEVTRLYGETKEALRLNTVALQELTIAFRENFPSAKRSRPSSQV